ncbi:hypothetical protein MHM98_03945 [Psychrobium sp. MM17-31]|uniref:hypothetical protein n=1 Tax=Psychrobium sp. MM17-31 TaxID=2917758 RepID=UPI001EF6AE67|nr:hypothetical protein [Psychrobium sp. MM17-31]MCG7530508.1 hypothetical protein [Psychrobium sp. MM17-31]
MKRLIFILIALLAIKNSNAGVLSDNCEVPKKLMAHVISEDVIGYISGKKSSLDAYLKQHGYKNFTDYTFTNERYSKAIELVVTNKELLGDKYIMALDAKINAPEKKEAMISSLKRVFKKCGKDKDKAFKKASDYSNFITGENKIFEYYLLTIATMIE